MNKFNSYIVNLRKFFIMKLIGKDLKVVSNIFITSDIVEYNKGFDITRGLFVKKVSDRQSFVYNPNSTNQINRDGYIVDEDRFAIVESKRKYKIRRALNE